MVKNYKKFVFIICILMTLQLNAQISQGGTPESFKRNFKNSIQEYVLPAVSENWKINQAANSEKNGTIDPIAKNIETNLTLQNSGTWIEKKNGDRIWRLTIKASNAIGINPLFKNFYLPEGSKLFVYNNAHTQILGAFTAKNNHSSEYFSTEIIFGNEMTIEYFEPKEVRNKGKFTIEKVGSFYKDLVHNDNTKGFNDPDNICQININCSEGNNFQDQKNGVARILTTYSSGQGWCSGSLINNAADNKEYFLTAYHCGDESTNQQFNQWIFYFNYEFNGCNNSTTAPITTNSVTGAQVKSRSNDLNSTSISSDFLLLELNNTIPSSYNPYYNGWNISSTTTSSGVGIHHPLGDTKKISTFTSTPSTTGVQWSGTGYLPVAGTTHWSLSWSSTSNGHGVTEGGSSGSPLFNSNGEIIGTLSGGGSKCVSQNLSDQYGKMSYHWSSNGTANNRQLMPFLDPNNTGITSLSGSSTPGSGSSGLFNDAALTSFVSPSNINCDFLVSPKVILKNNGTTNLLSASISYQLNSGAAIVTNWTGSLATGETEEVSLTSTITSLENNTITATVNNPNSLPDGNINDNSIDLDFEAGVSLSIPFYENFEANPTINNLAVVNTDNDETWSFSEYGGFEKSSNGVFIDNWDYDAVGQYDWFITDAYDFTNIEAEELHFDLAYTYYQQTNGTNVSYDSLGIAASLDCGETFTWIWKEGGINLATKQGGSGVEFNPTEADWDNKIINLDQFDGEASVQFAFIAINGYGNNLYLDNVLIGKQYVNIGEIKTFENQIKLFPNPAKDFISLEYPIEENLSFSIMNTIGQNINNGILNKDASLQKIDISTLNKGIYYIEVKSSSAKKIMKFVKE